MKESVRTRPLFHEGEKEKYQKGNGPWVGECPKGWRTMYQKGRIGEWGKCKIGRVGSSGGEQKTLGGEVGKDKNHEGGMRARMFLVEG